MFRSMGLDRTGIRGYVAAEGASRHECFRTRYCDSRQIWNELAGKKDGGVVGYAVVVGS